MLEGLKILAVDDALDGQRLLKAMLQMSGARVETAGDGQEAVQKLFEDEFDVVIMDIQMPVMDGYEAIAEMRNRGFRGLAIALSGRDINEKKLAAMAGFDDFLCKPIERVNLQTMLVEHVCKFRSAAGTTDEGPEHSSI